MSEFIDKSGMNLAGYTDRYGQELGTMLYNNDYSSQMEDQYYAANPHQQYLDYSRDTIATRYAAAGGDAGAAARHAAFVPYNTPETEQMVADRAEEIGRQQQAGRLTQEQANIAISELSRQYSYTPQSLHQRAAVGVQKEQADRQASGYIDPNATYLVTYDRPRPVGGVGGGADFTPALFVPGLALTKPELTPANERFMTGKGSAYSENDIWKKEGAYTPLGAYKVSQNNQTYNGWLYRSAEDAYFVALPSRKVIGVPGLTGQAVPMSGSPAAYDAMTSSGRLRVEPLAPMMPSGYAASRIQEVGTKREINVGATTLAPTLAPAVKSGNIPTIGSDKWTGSYYDLGNGKKMWMTESGAKAMQIPASGVTVLGSGGLPDEMPEPQNLTGKPVPQKSAVGAFVDVFSMRTPMELSATSEVNPLVGIPAVLSRADPYLATAGFNMLPGKMKDYLKSPEAHASPLIGDQSIIGGAVKGTLKRPASFAGEMGVVYATGWGIGKVATVAVPTLVPYIASAKGGSTFIKYFNPATSVLFGATATAAVIVDVARAKPENRQSTFGRDITEVGSGLYFFGKGFGAGYTPVGKPTVENIPKGFTRSKTGDITKTETFMDILKTENPAAYERLKARGVTGGGGAGKSVMDFETGGRGGVEGIRPKNYSGNDAIQMPSGRATTSNMLSLKPEGNNLYSGIGSKNGLRMTEFYPATKQPVSRGEKIMPALQNIIELEQFYAGVHAERPSGKINSLQLQSTGSPKQFVATKSPLGQNVPMVMTEFYPPEVAIKPPRKYTSLVGVYPSSPIKARTTPFKQRVELSAYNKRIESYGYVPQVSGQPLPSMASETYGGISSVQPSRSFRTATTAIGMPAMGMPETVGRPDQRMGTLKGRFDIEPTGRETPKLSITKRMPGTNIHKLNFESEPTSLGGGHGGSGITGTVKSGVGSGGSVHTKGGSLELRFGSGFTAAETEHLKPVSLDLYPSRRKLARQRAFESEEVYIPRRTPAGMHRPTAQNQYEQVDTSGISVAEARYQQSLTDQKLRMESISEVRLGQGGVSTIKPSHEVKSFSGVKTIPMVGVKIATTSTQRHQQMQKLSQDQTFVKMPKQMQKDIQVRDQTQRTRVVQISLNVPRSKQVSISKQETAQLQKQRQKSVTVAIPKQIQIVEPIKVTSLTSRTPNKPIYPKEPIKPKPTETPLPLGFAFPSGGSASDVGRSYRSQYKFREHSPTWTAGEMGRSLFTGSFKRMRLPRTPSIKKGKYKGR